MLLGVDLGTTNLKVAAYAPETGRIEAIARRRTRAIHPKPGWAEFDSDQLWTDTVSGIREVLRAIGRAHVDGIAVASMGESGVALDAHMHPVAPMIAWYDLRLEEQETWWRSVTDPWAIYQLTGLLLDRKFSVNHLLWLREHGREEFARARHWLCVPDFIAWKLCGEQVMDRSIASRTMLLDQNTLDWSAEMVALSRLGRSLLPPVVPSGTHIGHLTDDAAEVTGLATSTPVVSGGHDHLVGAFAAGLVRPGSVLDSTGTAEAVVQLTDTFSPRRELFEAGLETYAFVTPRTYAVLGAIDLAGGAVDWLIRLLWGDDPRAAEIAFGEAVAVAPGSVGCVWLPHLLGSGTPHNDSAARGAVVGLRPEHTRAHLLRGLLEGLAYWLRENLELAAARSEEVVAIGGATRTPFWTQLKADVCGRVFRVPEIEESVALGAALLAGIGAGAFSSPEEALASVRADSRRFVPDAAAARRYHELYARVYRGLYPALHEVNVAISSGVSC